MYTKSGNIRHDDRPQVVDGYLAKNNQNTRVALPRDCIRGRITVQTPNKIYYSRNRRKSLTPSSTTDGVVINIERIVFGTNIIGK